MARFPPCRSNKHRLARIVRGADHKNLRLAPQAAGPLAVTIGLSRMYPDDYDERLEYVLIVYDALYAWCGGRSNPAGQPVARNRRFGIKRPARAQGNDQGRMVRDLTEKDC